MDTADSTQRAPRREVTPPKRSRATPLRLEAPLQVIDPATGRVVLELAVEDGEPILCLFNSQGNAVVELRALCGGQGCVEVNTAQGVGVVSVSAHPHGGIVTVREPQQRAEGSHVCLYAEPNHAGVSLVLDDDRYTELRAGR